MTIAVAPRAIYLRAAMKFGVWSGDTAPTQYYDPVNFTKLAITSQTQTPEKLISNMYGSFGEALASVMKADAAASIAADADYMPPALFSLLLGADISEVSQATATIADEAITPAVGVWVPLANKYLAAHGTGTEIVAKTSADATIASSHYEIDLTNGLFKALDATGATVAKLSYHTATRTSEVYKGGKAKSSYVKLMGHGIEEVSKRRVQIIVHKALLAASSEVDIAAGGFMKGSFSGDLLTPTGQTSPWEFSYLDETVA